MAGWMIDGDGGDGSSIDCYEIIRNLQINGFCLGLDEDSVSAMKVSSVGCCSSGEEESEESNLRSWFDRILVDFFKEVSVGGEVFRPVPAMLGDGTCLDLFKLFWAVREKGGLGSVSKNGLWVSVAEECGLGSEVASPVKLLYFKYLDRLDRWVQRFVIHKGIGEDVVANCRGKLGVMLVELDSEFRDFFYGQRKIVEDSDEWSSYGKKVLVADMRNNGNTTTDNKCVDENGEEEDVMILDPSSVNEEMFSSKRKRETLSGIMNWVREISKHPGDSTIGKVEETSKQKTMDYLDLTLLARRAMFQKGGYVYFDDGTSPLQKKQKIHPSMYDDQLAIFKEVRCSPRILSQKLSKVQSCSDSCIATQTDLDKSMIPITMGVEDYPDKQLHKISDSSTDDKIDPFDDEQHIKDVSIGPLFQAEVPEWTGVTSESDSKWLGTQHWPVITEELNSLVEIDSIGKGRQNSCDCHDPGSNDCVKFHIAETRLGVKLELGSAFYRWRFQFMGEEVSLSWTNEEEKIFQSIVKPKSSSLEECFWDEASTSFPNKKRTNLVSYYFNVFLLRRRCFQNRVTPDNISSDDEEGDDNPGELKLGVENNGYLHGKR